MRIALINGGVVANIIEADLAFAQSLGYEQAVEDTSGTAALHGTYANGVFTLPAAAPAPAPTPITIMTKLTFLRRFMQAERIAIRTARATDPVIEDAESLLQLADDIDVADPDTVQYVGYLAQQGFLTQTRMQEILASG